MKQKTNATRVLWIAWWIFLFLSVCTFSNCSFNPHEPHHHDHEIVVIVSVFVVCDTVDVLIEFTVIGAEQPSIYEYYVNGVFVGRKTVMPTFLGEVIEVTFEVLFQSIVFGDVITIRPVSGSRAGVVGLSIVGTECAGGLT